MGRGRANLREVRGLGDEAFLKRPSHLFIRHKCLFLPGKLVGHSIGGLRELLVFGFTLPIQGFG